MNKPIKKLVSAAAALCLCIFSVYSAEITPSDTKITLGANDKTISFDIYLETDDAFAGAEFGIKPSQSDVEFSSLVMSDELKNESKVQTVKDGCLYFGFFSKSSGSVTIFLYFSSNSTGAAYGKCGAYVPTPMNCGFS